MKLSEKLLWGINIFLLGVVVILSYYVLELYVRTSQYQSQYYDLLKVISGLNTQIHYPGG